VKKTDEDIDETILDADSDMFDFLTPINDDDATD
jgi:hypothetical protein